jgi:hypothetical protein
MDRMSVFSDPARRPRSEWPEEHGGKSLMTAGGLHLLIIPYMKRVPNIAKSLFSLICRLWGVIMEVLALYLLIDRGFVA